MSERFPPIPRFPMPYPDESCYSILCRCTVYAAMSTVRLSREMFGRQRNLMNYLYQPFRPEELKSWFDDGVQRIPDCVQKHSCVQYRYPFLTKTCRVLLDDWLDGEELSNGDYKRITHGLGYRYWQKENLCYCPECVRHDRETYGETYWHMIPQLPGVTVCPEHMVPLEKSELTVRNTRYDLNPAEYWLPDKAPREETISYEDLMVAKDTQWMMENGWQLDGFEITKQLKGISLWQYEEAEAVAMRYSSRPSVKSETLYKIILANTAGMSISEFAHRNY